MKVIAERPADRYALYGVDDDTEDFRKGLITTPLLGREVVLSTGEVIGTVVEAGTWPFEFRAEDGETYPETAVVGVVWKHAKLLPLARDAELALNGDRVLLVGDAPPAQIEKAAPHRISDLALGRVDRVVLR